MLAGVATGGLRGTFPKRKKGQGKEGKSRVEKKGNKRPTSLKRALFNLMFLTEGHFSDKKGTFHKKRHFQIKKGISN